MPDASNACFASLEIFEFIPVPLSVLSLLVLLVLLVLLELLALLSLGFAVAINDFKLDSTSLTSSSEPRPSGAPPDVHPAVNPWQFTSPAACGSTGSTGALSRLFSMSVC